MNATKLTGVKQRGDFAAAVLTIESSQRLPEPEQGEERMKQRCRFCGCTQEDGCPAGCSWVEPDLCSVCAAFRDLLKDYIDAARRPPTKATLGRMLNEVTTPFMGEKAKPRT